MTTSSMAVECGDCGAPMRPYRIVAKIHSPQHEGVHKYDIVAFRCRDCGNTVQLEVDQ